MTAETSCGVTEVGMVSLLDAIQFGRNAFEGFLQPDEFRERAHLDPLTEVQGRPGPATGRCDVAIVAEADVRDSQSHRVKND